MHKYKEQNSNIYLFKDESVHYSKMRQKLPIQSLNIHLCVLMHQDCRELNLVHILRVQTIHDTIGQSDGKNNNIGPVWFQLILFHTERELSKFSAEISMWDVIVITILLRTYYNVYLLFLYISRNTYIRKSIGTDSVKKYRIYENNELFPYSYSLCTCDRIGARYLAKCGCQLYCHYSWCCLFNSRCYQPFWLFRPEKTGR